MALSRTLSQFAFAIFLALALTSSVANAEPRVVTEQFVPDPNPAIWTEQDLSALDDFVVLSPDLDLHELAQRSGVTEEVLAQLLQHKQTHNTLSSKTRSLLVLTGMSNLDQKTILFIPAELKKSLPRKFLKALYQDELERGVFRPALSFPSREALESQLQAQGASREAIQRITQDAIFHYGSYRLPLNQDTWKDLPASIRNETLEGFAHRNKHLPPRIGLNAKLVFHRGDDLHALAEKYAAGRNPAPIERLLRMKLGNQDSAEIPLETILPPFIRKNINQYALCDGPNCANSGVNSNRRNSALNPGITDWSELSEELHSRYRHVRSGEALRVGDVLFYQIKKDGKWVKEHVSYYIGDDLVFTKNGISRYAPYLIQTIDHNEAINETNRSKLKLYAYRLAKPSEKRVGKKPLSKSPVYDRFAPLRDSCGGMMGDLARRALKLFGRSR